MSNKFSFDTAESIISLLKEANFTLNQKNEEFLKLTSDLNDHFRDDRYDDFKSEILSVYNSCRQINTEIALIAESIRQYKERMSELVIDENGDGSLFGEITYGFSVMFGKAGELLERKNRMLEFQNEIKLLLKNPDIPAPAKKAYMEIGRKCIVADDEFLGVAHYDPYKKHIKFNLESDLDNPCGRLTTYFHEVGHMIDFQANVSHKISDDKEFQTLLVNDCRNYIDKVMNRYGCSEDTACWYISQELLVQNDLYADVSDILGGLTDGKCQNLWGHTRAYWQSDSTRIYREAFANMYSTSMSSNAKINVMKNYFPTAYSRFEELLEDM